MSVTEQKRQQLRHDASKVRVLTLFACRRVGSWRHVAQLSVVWKYWNCEIRAECKRGFSGKEVNQGRSATNVNSSSMPTYNCFDKCLTNNVTLLARHSRTFLAQKRQTLARNVTNLSPRQRKLSIQQIQLSRLHFASETSRLREPI